MILVWQILITRFVPKSEWKGSWDVLGLPVDLDIDPNILMDRERGQDEGYLQSALFSTLQPISKDANKMEETLLVIS